MLPQDEVRQMTLFSDSLRNSVRRGRCRGKIVHANMLRSILKKCFGEICVHLAKQRVEFIHTENLYKIYKTSTNFEACLVNVLYSKSLH